MTGREIFADAYIFCTVLIVAEEVSKRLQTKTGFSDLTTFIIFLALFMFGTSQMRTLRNTKKVV